MPVQFICPECYQEITADEEMVGTEATCPTCETTLRVPGADDVPAVTLGGYVLEKCLGEGRMGLVYRARQSTMNRVCALKILAPDLTDNDEYVKRFVEESRVNASIDHPHVVKYYDVGEADGRVYAAMAYIEGKDLATRIKDEGPLPEKEALEIGMTIAKTLKYVWENHEVLAQNLNPTNVFIDRHDQVKLMNLGVTRHKGAAPDASASLNASTIAYMSPEQATGGETSIRADIYSLGVTLYQAVTGVLPFGDSGEVVPVTQRRQEISQEMEQLLEKMTARAPVNRHEDWDDLLSDMKRVSEEAVPVALSTEEEEEEEEQNEARSKLRLRRDAEDEDDEVKPAIISTAAAEEAEARHAAEGGTPTMRETREDGELEPEPGTEKTPTWKKALRVALLLLALWVGFQYGFGPLLSAYRGRETQVYIVNDSPDQRYMVRLGWRRLRQELYPNGVVSFKLFVGMKERQGLAIKTIDENGKQKFLKKLKLPLSPDARVLVNLNQGQTYYIYKPELVKEKELDSVGQLTREILNMEKQLTAAEEVLESAKAIGRQAFVDQTDAEVIDLTEYRARASRVGYTAEQEDVDLPVLTDQPVALPIAKGASISYHHGKPETTTVNVVLTGKGNLDLGSYALQLENPRATVTQRDDTIVVNVQSQRVDLTEQGKTFGGQWRYNATKRPKQPWTWEWLFDATNQQGNQAATHRLRIRVPNVGEPESKVEAIPSR